MSRFLGWSSAAIAMIIAMQAPAMAQATAAPARRIYISVDMEGISGVVSPMQMDATGQDYQQYRKGMTAELLAAIEGARAAGATEFVVSDSHGNQQNLLLENLPPDITVIQGDRRPLAMMEGIDRTRFDGAMFIGYHAGASSARGIRPHTFSSARLSEVKVNGVAASEGYINAAIAAHFGVPVILLTGDDVVVEQLKPLLNGGETVAVKRAIGFQAAENIMPARARDMIRDAARRAVERISGIRPGKPIGPVTIDLTFHFIRPAEMLSWLPDVERTGARSVRFVAKDMPSALKLLRFALEYSPELEP